MNDDNKPYTWPQPVHVGDKITFQLPDGRLVTHRITGHTRHSGAYTPPPPLSRRDRILRKLTPPRWRKPLPQGYWGPDSVSLITVSLITEPSPAPGDRISPTPGGPR